MAPYTRRTKKGAGVMQKKIKKIEKYEIGFKKLKLMPASSPATVCQNSFYHQI